jgi:hypothetical protein
MSLSFEQTKQKLSLILNLRLAERVKGSKMREVHFSSGVHKLEVQKILKEISQLNSIQIGRLDIVNFTFHTKHFWRFLASFRHVNMITFHISLLKTGHFKAIGEAFAGSKIKELVFISNHYKNHSNWEKKLKRLKNLLKVLGKSKEILSSLETIKFYEFYPTEDHLKKMCKKYGLEGVKIFYSGPNKSSS